MALLYLLLEHQKKLDLTIHLAHLDHGWRAESAEEATWLQEMAAKLPVTFHSHRLTEVPSGDWENFARNKRYEFFTTLSQKLGAQSVILAHHADDRAEVVLKRIFEGAHLFHLEGMKEISQNGSLMLWRPLMQFHKAQIKSYLETKNLPWIEDKTNHEGPFLRTKMRKVILPFLEQTFGKDPTKSLLRLSEQACLVEEHFQHELDWIIQEASRGEICLEKFTLSKLFGFLIVKKLCMHFGLKASHEEILRGSMGLIGAQTGYVINSNLLEINFNYKSVFINQLELNV